MYYYTPSKPKFQLSRGSKMVKRISPNTDFFDGRTKPAQPKQIAAYREARPTDGLLGQRVIDQTSPLYAQPQDREDRPTAKEFYDVPVNSWLRGDGTKYPCFDSTSKRLKGGR